MKIYGWGRYSEVNAEVLEPKKKTDIKFFIKKNKTIIARGLGRSYGDSTYNNVVIKTASINHFVNFDSKNGIITCEAGISIHKINEFTIPKGWFIPVTPGSGYVTIGGAMANDIHGKNHHLEGTLSNYILSADLITNDGETITISNNKNTDLFRATCGGIGLTGIIFTITIKLKSISSSLIKNTIIKTNSLEDTCEQFESNFSCSYSVAWIDCLKKGRGIGRSLLFIGEHVKNDILVNDFKKPKYIPIKFCSLFLNKYSIKIFNAINYYKNQNKSINQISLNNYFYPLDSILDWNLLYGKKGFIQYQFVIPKKNGIKILKKILNIISEKNCPPFLAVLKLLGPQNKNYLSFPMEGYCLALDFKIYNNLLQLINILDKIIIDNGGRIYLAKDTLMNKNTFRICYPNWGKFQEIRSKYKTIGKFTSLQSKRLGLE